MRKRLLQIGGRIKIIRNSQGMTQFDLAKLAGVDYNTLRKVETGKTINPSVIFCAKIANALNVPISSIIFIENPNVTMEGCSEYLFSSEKECIFF
jgi:transcriptional regulator with XRE-family HTH domain